MNAIDRYALKQHLTSQLVKQAGTVGRYMGAHSRVEEERSKLKASRLKRKGLGHAMLGDVRDAGASIRDTFKGDLPAHTMSTKATGKAADWYRKRRKKEEGEDGKKGKKGRAGYVGKLLGEHRELRADRFGITGDRLRRKGVGHAAWGSLRDAGATIKGEFRGDLGGHPLSIKATKRRRTFLAARRAAEAKSKGEK
jgi:hypothetical protein